MGTLQTSLAGLAVVLTAFTLLWAVSLRLRDASIVDPFWGPGFVLVGIAYLWGHGDFTPRGLLAVALVLVWALRLGLHLLARNRKLGEDPRYAAMRERYGRRFGWVSLATVFWLQAVVLWIVSSPILAAVVATAPLGAWDAAGVVAFLVGFLTEAVADAQLARFRSDPANRGSVLDRGLWRYSRHPNYFGDALLWWGLWLVAVGAGAPWSALGPLVMTFLLLKVSGVTLLERSLAQGRPGYADYVRRTSVFVPWFPRD